MRNLNLAGTAALFILLTAGWTASAQVNLAGEWAMTLDEDQPERLPGPEIGDYLGIPINAAARLHAESWDASLLALPEYQCRVHPVDYVPSFFNIRVWEERDKDSQELIAFHVHHQAWGTERTIWMDGRPHPPDYAMHTSQGFSTGKWDGEILTVTTTHLKQGWIRRNGIPRSDRAIVYENFIRHGDHLTWTTVVHDPAYLTETFIRTRDFELSIGLQMGAYPCESVVEVVMPKGKIPNHLPGTNTFLAEFPERYGIPAEAAMGGAETMYPEYREKLKTLPKPVKK